MEAPRVPLVSIGVPVYNGERGLSRCLESLLQQDYGNLEIIVSDNASTDGTPDIAAQYARRDPRIRYVRSDRNRGTWWNFNRVFELSTGQYFMWAAHDDDRDSGFISACVERLEQSPDAVLCQAHTSASIEGRTEVLYVASLDSFASVHTVVDRYRETLKRFPATAMYGLYRASAMSSTMMFARVIATDMAFIQELSIHGRFVQVPGTMFRYSARPSWNTVQQDARVVLGRQKPWWYIPFIVMLLHNVRRIGKSAIPAGLKIRLCGVLAGDVVRQCALKVALRVAGALCPEARKESLARAMYWRWMHNPNLQVVDHDLFFERVCKPQIGWWR